MNFGAVDGASLRSGYALPACRPVNGGFINRRTVHLSKPKRCLDKPGHLSLMDTLFYLFIQKARTKNPRIATTGPKNTDTCGRAWILPRTTSS